MTGSPARRAPRQGRPRRRHRRGLPAADRDRTFGQYLECLSIQDYEVLVHLTDNPDGRVRVTELAGLLQWERSRVSHHIKRMEHRRLVQRAECSEDGRGAFVAITPQGRAAIEEAAPSHVMTVRRLMFDALSEEEKAALAAVIDKLLARTDHAPTH
jgi:DNA-binding MarR family transcriptional regulator